MDTRLDSTPTTTADQIADHLYARGAKDPNNRPGFLREMVHGYWELGAVLNINPEWAVAQFCLETGHPTNGHPPGVSSIWLTRGMPAGMGVTDGHDYGYGFPTGAEAAQGQMCHLYLYCHGTTLPDGYEWLKGRNPRWDAVLAKGWQGTARTVDDLAGKWATDPAYGSKLTSRYRTYIEDAPAVSTPQETPVALTFGRVPHPGYIDKQSTTAGKPAGRGWDNLGKRNPKFIALHRMWGTLAGTASHFANPNVASLTDYGIGTANIDGAASDGVIHKYNDPLGYRSGWASGPVSAPYGDGKKIVDKYGINAVNRDGVSIETSGYDTEPFTDFAWSELVALIAYWADYCKIPYTALPLNPHTGINFIIWHNEFTNGTGKQCPFTWMRQNTSRLYRDVAAYLKPFQEGEAGGEPPETEEPPVEEPAFARPEPIPALASLADMDKNTVVAVVQTEGSEFQSGDTFTFVGDRVRAIRSTPRLQRAAMDADRVGVDIAAGEAFDVRWIATGADGRDYYISPWWTRILVADTERIAD